MTLNLKLGVGLYYFGYFQKTVNQPPNLYSIIRHIFLIWGGGGGCL